MEKNKLPSFLKRVRFGYLLGTSLVIIFLIFGFFEIVQLVLFSDLSENQVRWLNFSRGILTALVILFWATWTIYQYRDIFKSELEAAEERYYKLLEQAADAIITTTPEGIITSWNRGAENLFGWRADEIKGKHITVLIPDVLIKQGEIECLTYGLEENGFVNHYETERLHKDGSKRLVNLSETQIKDATGKVTGKAQILRDLTEAKLKEQQFQQSERLASVGHMAAGVAHEIGNPLASISSLTQLLQRRAHDPFSQEQLKKVRQQINRINTIVRDLVDFSRPSNQDPTETNVNELITSAVGLLKHDARCRDINFNIQIDPQITKVYIVPDQLHQVIVNLLLNAADALEDTENPIIYISTKSFKGRIRIKICDNGPGIPEEIRDRIFEPFFTTKETGSGTGLGLSVSHGIIQSMNGTIVLGTKEGRGSCFRISLPGSNTL